MKAPTSAELTALTATLGRRIGRDLERQWLLERDVENSTLVGDRFDDGVAKVAGFSLHAGLAARADQRQKLERQCRDISRPVIAEQRAATAGLDEPTPAERRAAMRWAQRLKRVFGIDLEICAACGGAGRTIACSEDAEAIERILTHCEVGLAAIVAAGRGEREKRAGEPIAAVDPGAATPL